MFSYICKHWWTEGVAEVSVVKLALPLTLVTLAIKEVAYFDIKLKYGIWGGLTTEGNGLT